MSRPAIRLAGPADLPVVVEIYNEAVARRFATADLDPVTVEGRRGWFDQHGPDGYPLLLAEDAGAVVGWAALSPYRPGRRALRHTAELAYYVRYASHGRGLGTELVRGALDEARRVGLRVVVSIVLECNTASVGLLEAEGFERWGRLPDVAEIEGTRVAHLYYGRPV